MELLTSASHWMFLLIPAPAPSPGLHAWLFISLIHTGIRGRNGSASWEGQVMMKMGAGRERGKKSSLVCILIFLVLPPSS